MRFAGAGVHPRRQVRDRPAPRQWRHGGGLPGAPRPPAGAAGGQDPAPGPRGRPFGPEAVHARGAPRHPDQAPQRRHPLRLLDPGGRQLLHGLGAHPGAGRRRPHPPPGAVPGGGRRPPRHPGAARPRSRPRHRGDPPRPLARQPHDHRGQGRQPADQDHRPRPRAHPGDRRQLRDHPGRHVHGQAPVLLARAGEPERRRPRSPQRPLLLRHRALRDDLRPAAVRVGEPARLHLQAAVGGPAAAARAQPPGRRAGRARPRRPPRPGARPRAALRRAPAPSSPPWSASSSRSPRSRPGRS